MISVIIPVYKVENYLHRCIDSVLGQTYQNFEVILVDDGSPDNCGAICDAYAAKDPRIHVIHQQNAGVSAARNAGIEYALKNRHSEWLLFLDSDDWIHKDFMKILINHVQTEKVQIAMCELLWTNSFLPDRPIEKPESIVLEPEQALVNFHPLCTGCCNKIISKSIFAQLRFPIGMRYEDAYISHKMILLAEKVSVCREALYYYYHNSESFTRSAWTENRLVAIDVHESRLAYFFENGYEQAYRKEQELYMEILTDNLQCLMYLLGKGDVYQENFNKLLSKHREAFYNARKQKTTNLRRETIWFYIFGLPVDWIWKLAKFLKTIYHQIK